MQESQCGGTSPVSIWSKNGAAPRNSCPKTGLSSQPRNRGTLLRNNAHDGQIGRRPSGPRRPTTQDSHLSDQPDKRPRVRERLGGEPTPSSKIKTRRTMQSISAEIASLGPCSQSAEPTPLTPLTGSNS